MGVAQAMAPMDAMSVGHDNEATEGAPYGPVPEAWRRVLNAWHSDVVVGAGLPDSCVSVGRLLSWRRSGGT